MTEKRHSTMLRIEALETREMLSAAPGLPSAVVARESFDQTTIGELPAGWAQWDSQATFQVLPWRSLNGGAGLVASGSSGETARAWLGKRQAADVQITSTLRLDSIIPAELLLRGKGLDTTSPTYYELTLARGLDLQLWRVVNGNRRFLGSIHSSDYTSGPWMRAVFQADGDTLRAMIYRLDTKQFLNASGHWQSASTWALTKRDSAITGPGYVGLGRQSGYAGDTVFSDFQAVTLSKGRPVPPPTYNQQFSGTPVGSLPKDWVQWSNQAPAAVTADHALTGSKGLRFDAGSGNTARAWISDTLPADLQASAAVLLSGLIPADLFVRGHGLDTATPTYYAATVTRGLDLQLWKVLGGVRTSLGKVHSNDYMSGQWVRVSLDVAGATLRLAVQRMDNGQYLDTTGHWRKNFKWALVRQDATIAGPGKVGLGREASYSGASTFDDFQVTLVNAPPPPATLSGLADSAVLTAPVRVEAKVAADAHPSRVEFFVDGRQKAVDASSPFQWTVNPGSFSPGPHQLTVRIVDTSGHATILERDFTVAKPLPIPSTPPGTTSPSPSAIPSHYSWIRLAELAYFGVSIGAFEKQLLRDSIDLVIPDERFLHQIGAVASSTPQLLYTNASSLYQDSLLDWLNYADAHGISREDAFYHVATPTAFSGESPSSQPVNWFWGVYLSGPGGLQEFTSHARSMDNTVTLGQRGQSLYLGYPDRFREINLNLVSGAANGWSSVLEYATKVDSRGHPIAWAPLKTLGDSTGGLKHSGQITFDPPRDWQTSIVGGTNRLFYVRLGTVSSGKAPVAHTILGRDYVNARGSKSGVIPVFDYSADLNHDGYLNDSEWAHRTPGMNARFAYESRLFLGYYGQMRPATNPSNANLRAWLIDFEQRFLRAHPLAGGVFIDNSGGKPPATDRAVLENTFNYTADYGTMLNGLTKAIAPRLVLVNTSNGTGATNAIVSGTSAYFEEFALRPMSGTYQQFEDQANSIANRQNTRHGRTPYAIL
ncbi:MAG TPA: Ig-like domain-containing protein, partial [Gemmataceae bacterium]|nr:Ig-like domain-containing protein [Gemmataceae bacterium]